MPEVSALQDLCFETVAAHMWHENDNVALEIALDQYDNQENFSFKKLIKVLADEIPEEKVKLLPLPKIIQAELRIAVSARGVELYRAYLARGILAAPEPPAPHICH